jgi:hypothetical protein
MKDRYYLRYDGTESEQRISGAQWNEMQAVKSIHASLIRLDAARADLKAAQESLRRAVRNVSTPKQIRRDFELFWDTGGATADAYRHWFHGGYMQPPMPVRAKKHMRLIVNKAVAPVVCLSRERLDEDGPHEAA